MEIHIPTKKKRAPYGSVKAAKLAALAAQLKETTPVPRRDYSLVIAALEESASDCRDRIEYVQNDIEEQVAEVNRLRGYLADIGDSIDLLKSHSA